jgi:hypothetical protein
MGKIRRAANGKADYPWARAVVLAELSHPQPWQESIS